jgi:uncharacterized protein (TIGR02145 family)
MFNKLLLLGLILVGCLCSSAIQAQDCPTVGFDADGDLSIGVSDLVQFLGVFGQNLDQDGDGIIDCEDPCVGDSIACPPWSCGDDLEYFGYAYQTVAIGDQCWFEENLQTEFFTNGDSITHTLDNAAWADTWVIPGGAFPWLGTAASSIYGSLADSSCFHFSPTIDPCNENESLAKYGRLYNAFAVIDERGMCPPNWHVASPLDWGNLSDEINSLGLVEFGGQGINDVLKSTDDWRTDTLLQYGNGFDLLGFDAEPAGRRMQNGYYTQAGSATWFWAYYPGGFNQLPVISAFMLTNDLGGGPSINFFGNEPDLRVGHSIRCIKD